MDLEGMRPFLAVHFCCSQQKSHNYLLGSVAGLCQKPSKCFIEENVTREHKTLAEGNVKL